MDNYVKKSKSGITPTLKKAVWDLYIGIGVQRAPCPVCGVTELSRTANSGFEAAHIVADKYFTEELSTLYLFPCCKPCNNECRDLCLLDFVWCRERHHVLRKMIWDIFCHYQNMHPGEPENQAWKILDHLYGPKRFSAGGGLVNRTQIYLVARMVQMDYIVAENIKLHQEIQQNSRIMQRLMEEKYPENSFQ